MTEHAVSTSDIRAAVAHSTYHALEEGMVTVDEPYAAFDRWLAEHDCQVAQKALTDAAEDLDGSDGLLTISGVRDALRARAGRLHAGAGNE